MSRMHWFDWRKSCRTGGGRQAAPRRSGKSTIAMRRLGIEPLEDRRMLAAITQAVAPLGSLVYTEPAILDAILAPGEVDLVTLNLEAGQKLSVMVNPNLGLTPQVEVLDPIAVPIALDAATSPGESALVQTVTIATAGVYTVRVSGVGSSVGDYGLVLLLNAAQEEEDLTGVANGSAATAQSLDGSFTALGLGGAERGAVTGSNQAAGAQYSHSITQVDLVHTPNVLTYFFPGATPPLGDATLRLDAIADLDSSAEFLTISYEGLYTETAFVTGGAQQSPVSTTLTIPQATLAAMAADGTITLTVTPSTAVSNLGSNQLTMQLDYPVVSGNDDWYSFTLDDGEAATLAIEGAFGSSSVELYASDGVTLLATGPWLGGVRSVITDFVDPTTDGVPATYYARVAPGALNYTLVVTRDAAFDRDFNDFPFFAQDITLTGMALGGLWLGDVDYYRVNAQFLNFLSVQALTPGSAPGDFANSLDVLVELLDPNGNVIASGPSGSLSQLVFQDGPYVVRVSAEGSTAGEYVLQVTGYTGAVDAFQVTSVSPPDGSTFGLGQTPTQMTVTLSADALPTSVQASDLTVNGVPATGVTIDALNTLRFDLPSTSATGVYQVAIAAGAITTLSNTPLAGFGSSFTVDATGPRVIASSIQPGGIVSGGLLTYTVQFDEPLAAGNLDSNDVSLYELKTGSFLQPLVFNYDAGSSTLTLQYSGLSEGLYQLTLGSGDGSFEDVAGNDLDGEIFATPIGPNTSGDGVPGGSFTLQFFAEEPAPVAIPTPLSPAAPLGTLAYEGWTIGTIGVPGDVDLFTLPIEKNQLVSLIVQGSGGLTPMVTLETPGVPLTATATAPGPDGAAVLSGIPAVAIGVYQVRVQAAAGTSGGYSVRVVLNAVLEDETHGGADNGSQTTAEDLDSSFQPRGSNSALATVLGNGESGGGPQFTASQTHTNNVHTPNVLTYVFAGAPTPLGDATLTLSAVADLDLTSEYLRVEAEGLLVQDVFVVGGAQQQLVTAQLSISQATMAALAADGIIIITVTPSSSVGNLGSNSLTLEVAYPTVGGAVGGDWYQFSLEDGESTSVVLGGAAAGSVALYDPAGVLLARGIGIDNATRLVANVVDNTSDGLPAVYRVHVSSPGQDYSLTVMRNATFDGEPNNGAAEAQDIGGSLGVAGHVQAFADEDWYQFGVNAGDILRIQTFTPGAAAGEPTNALDPAIDIFDANFNVVTYQNKAGNELLFHVAQTTGSYRLRVHGNEAGGEYFLQVEGATGGSVAPLVVDTDPDSGAKVAEFPLTYTLTLSEELDPASVQPSDLLFGGLPATAVTAVDGRTYEFTVDATADIGTAIYLIELAAGAVTDLQGQGNLAFATTLELDVTAPRIVSTRWNGLPLKASRLYNEGSLTFEATFSEDLYQQGTPGVGFYTPGTDDVVLLDILSQQTIFPATVTYDPATDKLLAFFTNVPEGDYTLTVRGADGAIEDLVGNDLDGEAFGPALDGTLTGNGVAGGNYSVDISVDRTTTGALQPFVALEPLGGLIAASLNNVGLINGAGDQDVIEFVIEGGQTLSAVVTPADPNVRLSVQLVGVTGVVTAASPGAPVALPLTAVPAAALYELRISGDARSAFSLDVIVNAAVEPGDEAGPVAMDGSFVSLGSGRYAAIGRSTASPAAGDLIVNGSFETGNFNGWTTTVTASPFAPWTVSGAGVGSGVSYGMSATQPQDGGWVAWNGFDGSGPMEYTMFQDVTLPSTGGLLLSWKDRLQWNYTLGNPATLPRLYSVEVRDPSTNALLSTLYSFSTDVEAVNPTGNTGWQSHSASLSPYAGQTVRLVFREQIPQVSTGPAQFEIDAISLPNPGVGGPDTDEYTVDLTGKAGQRIDVVLTGLGGADFSGELLELLDDVGNVLAVGSADPLSAGFNPANFDVGLLNFTVPDVGSNVYTLRVYSTVPGEYSLVVTEDLVFDVEAESGPAPVRSLDTVGAALGHLAVETVIGSNLVEPDNYAPGTPLNNVVPGVTLSVVGVPGFNVTPALTSLASPPGSSVFSRGGTVTWSPSQGLRADFAMLTDQVSINVGSDDSADVSVLQAFNANGSLLASVLSSVLTAGQWQTLTITRPTSDIAYVVASGSGGDVTLLDRLVFNSSAVAAAGDVYEVTLLAGQSVTVFTDTPLDDAGTVLPNGLNPLVRLIGPSGATVAIDADSRDGKNAELSFTASVSGTYRVQIEAEAGEGAYVLRTQKGALPADFDDDADIDGADFLSWQRGLGQTAANRAEGDATGDGVVDGQDLARWRDGFGSSAPASIVALAAATASGSLTVSAANVEAAAGPAVDLSGIAWLGAEADEQRLARETPTASYAAEAAMTAENLFTPVKRILAAYDDAWRRLGDDETPRTSIGIAVESPAGGADDASELDELDAVFATGSWRRPLA